VGACGSARQRHGGATRQSQSVIEGQEEIGSPDLANALEDHADRLVVDLVVLSDTMTWSADRPAVCVRVRGLMHAELEVRGSHENVHAGMVAGVAPDSVSAHADLFSRLHDGDGLVQLPGFYDDVRQPSAAERETFSDLTADETDWLQRTRTRSVTGEAGWSLGERLWVRPSVDVLAIRSGELDPPLSGTMPATATALLQLCLVPDQQPEQIAAGLRDWVAATMPPEVDYELRLPGTTDQPAYATPSGHPAIDLLQAAMSECWGRPAGRMGNAGSRQRLCWPRGPKRLSCSSAPACRRIGGTPRMRARMSTRSFAGRPRWRRFGLR
jgi:acetylornithine deacetylase/succinyl-diaminopimelate desuccinylase-like protein